MYFRSARRNKAKQDRKANESHEDPRDSIQYQPFHFSPGKTSVFLRLLLLDLSDLSDFDIARMSRAPRTLRESSIHLQRASPGNPDKRAWRRGMGLGSDWDLTGSDLKISGGW